MRTKKYPKTREGMWRVIRELKVFTHLQIAEKTKHHVTTVQTFVQLLIKGGFVQVDRAKTKVGERAHFRLIRNVGQNVPRLTGNGKVKPPGERQRMWTALRVTGASPFDWRDLSLVADTKPNVAKEYIRFLELGGYLKITRQGGANLPTLYVLIRSKYSGPFPPEIHKRKTQVYDPNTRKVVWEKEQPL